MVVTLRELTDENRGAVLALRVAPEQERFVGGSVQAALRDAAEYPHARPWYRAIYADHEPVARRGSTAGSGSSRPASSTPTAR